MVYHLAHFPGPRKAVKQGMGYSFSNSFSSKFPDNEKFAHIILCLVIHAHLFDQGKSS